MKRPNKLHYIENITDVNGKIYCFYRADTGEHCAFINGEIPVNGTITIIEHGEKIDMYYKDGHLHREDGPAIDGAFRREFMARFYYRGLAIDIRDLWDINQNTEHAPKLMAHILGNKNG